MAVRRVQLFYQHRAKQYQQFFVEWLGWENVLGAFFAENNILSPGTNVLDAGCGTGSVTKALYRLALRQGLEGIRFYAFDLTPAMLALFSEWIAKEGAQGIFLRQADVLQLSTHLPEDWRGFDWIVSSAMLEYIPEHHIDQALRNLKERLRPDGQILLFLTRRTWVTRWTGARWWGTNLFDANEVEEYLKHAGFSHIEFRPLPSRWGSFMMAVTAKGSTSPGYNAPAL
jgi:SAM-dependent methyltransferase